MANIFTQAFTYWRERIWGTPERNEAFRSTEDKSVSEKTAKDPESIVSASKDGKTVGGKKETNLSLFYSSQADSMYLSSRP